MNRLKMLREEREYSVRGLDNKIGIDFNSIFRYENETRDPNTTTLKKFADFFEVTIDYLLSYSDCFIYCSYENDNFKFKIREDYYTELKKRNYVYFIDDKRYINLNKLLHVDKDINLLPLMIEFSRIDRVNCLFDKVEVTDEDIKEIRVEITDIEITKVLINFIKESIK